RAVIAERDGDDVMEAHAGGLGDFDGVVQHHVWIDEHAVDAQPPRLMMLHRICDLIRGPSIYAGRAAPRGLRGWVVGNFRLIEIIASILAVPKHLVFLVMLDEESIGGHVIAVDDQTVVADVLCPAHPRSVVGTPNPDVVDD